MNIAARGPLRSTQVPNDGRRQPEHHDRDREDDPDRGQAGVEVLDQRGLVDAGRVGLPDAQVDGERRRRDQPPVEPGLGDDALAGQEAGDCHGTTSGVRGRYDRSGATRSGAVTLRRCGWTLRRRSAYPRVQRTGGSRSGRRPAAALGSVHGLRGEGRRRPQQGCPRHASRRSSSPIPGPGEAVVDVQACGVCHTDLHYREGGINDDFPFLLGHEAAGVVEAVGEGVTDVAVGDYVILNWRAVCGQCRACRRGRALVLLQHPQRRAEDDAGRRHRALPGARHRRVRREDAGRTPGSARRSTRRPRRPRPACSAAA